MRLPAQPRQGATDPNKRKHNMGKPLLDRALNIQQVMQGYGLMKTASQTVEHLKSPMELKDRGKEQTAERHTLEGVAADTPTAENRDTASIPSIPNAQNLNTTGARAMSASGSSVVQTPETASVSASNSPLAKTAADYQLELARLLRLDGLAKQAAAQEQEQTQEQAEFVPAVPVMDKLASLRPYSGAHEFESFAEDMRKLASGNPFFRDVRDTLLMRKLAADAEELAAQTGVTPEEAAAALDEAAAEDPAIMDSAVSEAEGEALQATADAEMEAAALMDGAQQLADNASAALGQEVTADDIVAAAAEVEQMAAEAGVDPMDLIQAAAAQMEAATEEELAQADQILQAGAEMGLTPEETIQAVSDEMSGAAAPAEGEVKQASVQGLSPRVSRAVQVLAGRR